MAEKKEAYPLSWPEDWPRARPPTGGQNEQNMVLQNRCHQ